MTLLKKILKWVGIILLSAFMILFVIRWNHIHNGYKTEEQIIKIHNTKLTLDDVLGKNLPPDPGAEANKTITGIDANRNGIRDDVELAIFKEYPKSAKTRAVLLQYALALQMEFNQQIINTATVTEVIREENRANSCVGDTLVPRKNPESGRSETDILKIDKFIIFVKSLQINTKARDQAQAHFYTYLRSYNSLEPSCDINYSTLPN